jgi:DNA-binding response OmpR family regulator
MNEMTDNIVLSGRVVFVVDDDELFRAYVATLLSQASIKVISVSNSVELVTQMHKIMPDCILLDYMLASENGLQIHEHLRRRFQDLPPVLMLSADETQRTAIRAFRFGMNDFIPKRNLRLDDLLEHIRAGPSSITSRGI